MHTNASLSHSLSLPLSSSFVLSIAHAKSDGVSIPDRAGHVCTKGTSSVRPSVRVRRQRRSVLVSCSIVGKRTPALLSRLGAASRWLSPAVSGTSLQTGRLSNAGHLVSHWHPSQYRLKTSPEVISCNLSSHLQHDLLKCFIFILPPCT